MTMVGKPGEIITFYSYKGGTGRSMALSNVACLLAERQSKGRGVLMIDWDLEAPGLDNYFQNIIKIQAQDFKEKNGLIDLFSKIDEVTPKSIHPCEEEPEKIAYDALDSIDLDDFIVETDIENLFLLKAGRFDVNYSNKVNSFDWESLNNRSPLLIRLFAERLAERYRYILIDSRTGYTDISGICTMLMPDKLVVVFSPNRQNHTGIKELVVKAMKYRRKSDDLRPLLLFPLPSRIEFSMDELRRDWRFGKTDRDIEGFQPMFETIFKDIYELSECNLQEYFDEVQIQQNPYYAYGEEIAVRAKRIEERFTDRFTLTESFKIFTEWLVNSAAPWQRIKEKTGDIFLSYAQADRDKVQAIAEALEQQGFSVWWDRSILPGTKFVDVMEEKIKAAKCVIVFWSKDSVKSEWVQNEAFEGAKNQTLIPIFIDDVMPPIFFSEINTLNLINWKENVQSPEFSRLIESIKNLLSGRKEDRGGNQNITTTLDQLATIELNQGKYEAARYKFQKSLEIKQQNGDRGGEAGAWNQLATIDLNQRKYEAARQKFQKSLEIKQQIGDRGGEAEALNQLATIEMNQGKYEAARQKFQKSLEIKQQIGDRGGEAGALNQLATIDMNMGEYHTSLENSEQALSIYKEIYGEEHHTVATSLNYIGSAWDKLGEYKKGLEYYLRALYIRKNLYGEKHPNVASSLNNIGLAWDKLGEYDKAIDYYEQALSIYNDVYGERHPNVATCLNNIALAWDKLGDYKNAINYYEQALSIYKEVYGENHPTVATSLNNVGLAWDELGKYKNAIDYYEQALSIYEEVYGEKHSTVATCLNNIGSAWDKLGDSKEAINYYERALSIILMWQQA